MTDEQWKKINRQACSTIRLCLAKDQKYHVMNENIAYKLWKSLEDKYVVKSVSNRIMMQKRLFRFNKKPGTSMIEHLSEYNRLIVDALNIDVKLDDEIKTCLFLASLPDSYETFIDSLSNKIEDKTLKFDDVTAMLISYEIRQKDRN